MKSEVCKMWVEANLKSIVREGCKHLQFSAEDLYFKKAALEVVDDIAKSTSNMFVFAQRFWPHYYEKLRVNNGQPAPKLLISQEGGELIATITSYEEIPIEEPKNGFREFKGPQADPVPLPIT